MLAVIAQSVLCALHGTRPLHVQIDGTWYDLAKFRHPGGMEVLWRNSGREIAPLFYSNHHTPQAVAIERFKLNRVPDDEAPLESASSPCLPHPHTALYQELKADVFRHLEEKGIEWRHRFRWEPFGLRLLCLIVAHWGHFYTGSGSVVFAAAAHALGLGSAAVYGFLTGRMTWTHAHTAVHNPSVLPAAMRHVMRFDFVGVVEAWMAEHHAHHAHTNGACDPDVGWFRPLFDYSQLAAHGGSARTTVLAALVYPALLPLMLTKSLAHALASDPDARATLRWVVAVAPLRFALDAWALGPSGFAVALSVATTYICGTFVATHQTAANHGPSSGDWAVDQMRATNDVWPESRLWCTVTGGISLHTEHHLFPQISPDALPEVAYVVTRFAKTHGLPRHSFSPHGLLGHHVALLRNPKGVAPGSAEPQATVATACPITKAISRLRGGGGGGHSAWRTSDRPHETAAQGSPDA